MLERLIRKAVFKEFASPVRILFDERKEFERAMQQATERGKGGRSDPVVIEGRRMVVVDDGAARLVEPA